MTRPRRAVLAVIPVAALAAPASGQSIEPVPLCLGGHPALRIETDSPLGPAVAVFEAATPGLPPVSRALVRVEAQRAAGSNDLWITSGGENTVFLRSLYWAAAIHPRRRVALEVGGVRFTFRWRLSSLDRHAQLCAK